MFWFLFLSSSLLAMMTNGDMNMDSMKMATQKTLLLLRLKLIDGE